MNKQERIAALFQAKRITVQVPGENISYEPSPLTKWCMTKKMAHHGGEGLCSTSKDFHRFIQLLMNKGEFNGITREMGVISSKGVVGIIKNITDNYSSIVSLLNTDLRINAILKNSSTIGSISWNGLDPRIVQLNDIPLSSSIKVGDTIVTGGMSFYFPKGIPIGKIEDYNNTSLEGYYSIDVSIFNDFSSLSNLYILERTDNDEIKFLLNE